MLLTFIWIYVVLFARARAAVLNDHHFSILDSRSTFSTDSDDANPQSINYVNFKITNSSGARIDYLSPIGSSVPYSHSLGSSKVNIPSGRSWALVTSFAPPTGNCTTDLTNVINAFTADDVWSAAFSDDVLVSTAGCGEGWANKVKGSLQALNFSSNAINTLSGSGPASGPYLVLASNPSILYPVYRVYTDTQYAFTSGLLPINSPSNVSETKFVQSPSGGQDAYAMSAIGVPVPSRLYFLDKQTTETPLAGMRVGIKDIFDVAGVRTGCGSRAYYAFYNAAEQNSFAVQALLAKGAVVVGKTKASQFANGESATADWVDQLCPFNARGDGYQDPSSSSSGSGAAVGAYSWLDVALGSDTGGSIRGPAGVNGILGIRPSTGAISLTGAMPLSDVQDTAGYFTRDAHSFEVVGKAFYGDFVTTTNADTLRMAVKTVLVPNDFWQDYLMASNGSNEATADPSAGTVGGQFATFVNQFAKFLANATQDSTNFTARWSQAGNEATYGLLSAYLNTTYPVLIGNYQNRVLAQPFLSQYSAANDGRNPFIDPVPLVRWAYGAEQDYQTALDEQNVFTNFSRSYVLPGDCSSVLVYPQADGSDNPRNVYLKAPRVPTGFSAGRLANVAGLPEIVLPIGQVALNSSVTLSQSESLPVAISIVGGRNCDGQLLNIAAALEKASITKPVRTGSSTF